MRILLTGSGGQLSRAFQKRLSSTGYRVFAPPEDAFDICDTAAVAHAFGDASPDIVINCAAYNDVDGAEADYDKAFKVNALGPRILAEASRKHESLLVHYSTDYVFDGTKEGFYTEDDAPCPVNRYGESKLAGEAFVAQHAGRHLILRTSWLYGEGDQNFLRKLRQWAGRQQVLKIVADQVSVPTYAVDVVSATLAACGKGLQGLYHLTNSGYATRYEVARYYLSKIGSASLVLPVTTDIYPSPARRPYFSVMSSSRLTTAIGREMPHWKDAIDRYLLAAGLAGKAK
jgi:dTDP-4-dehydrorhamnose reductase